MAQYKADSSYLSNLPALSTAGNLMTHRCAVVFDVAASLTAADTFLLGQLPAGYIVDDVLADGEGIAGLSLSVTQTDSLTAPSYTLVLADDISLVTAGRVAGAMKLNAVRSAGYGQNQYLVAKVVGTGTLAKGKEIGVTIKYRYRQV